MRRAEVTVGVPGDHVERFLAGRKGVEVAGGDLPRHSGRERKDALRRAALAPAAQDNAQTRGGVRVRRLLGMRRDVQVVEARLPANWRADQQRVRASVDIAQPAGSFQRPADLPQSPIAQPRITRPSPPSIRASPGATKTSRPGAGSSRHR